MKRSLCCVILFACGTLFLGASRALADKIFLKNGKVYEGKVVGKSDQRYLFAIQTGGKSLRLSFFTDEVDRVDMEKDSVQRQIPFLKEVKDVSFNVPGRERAYEISLYNKEQQKSAFEATDWYTSAAIKEVLTEDEYAYYEAFGDIAKRFATKFVVVDTMYADLSVVTRDDFETAKVYMVDLYEELAALKAPPAFRESLDVYMTAVKATAMSFDALGARNLETASQQAQISQEYRVKGMKMFSQAVQVRRVPTEPTSKPGAKEPAE